MSVLTVLAGLAVSAPAQAASEVRNITRDGVVMQHLRVAKAATPVQGTGATRSDFDGDGVDDIAVAAEIGGTDAIPYYATGGVVVRYSSAPQVDYLNGTWTINLPAAFGSDLAAGDFNGDGFDDLAIGAELEVDLSNKAPGGAVWIIPGSRTGLVVDSTRRFTQGSPGVPGDSEAHDRFGLSLATGDINGDGRDDLAIGAPGESIGSVVEAGAVTVLYGGVDGLTASGVQQLHQNQAAVPGTAEHRDLFGRSLAIGKVNNNRYADLIIGAPNENDGSGAAGSGMITLMWGSASGVKLSGATSVTGAAIHHATGHRFTIAWYLGRSLAVGDVNGDGLGEVVVGAPSAQGPEPNINAGLVAVFTGRRTGGLSSSAVKVFTQATPGVPGSQEDEDRFGEALAVGDVTGDGRADVLIGAPGEAIGTRAEAGTVALLKGSASGLTASGAQGFDQNHSVVPGGAESGDRFGASVAILNLNGTGPLDAVVGSPDEEVAGDSVGSGSGTLSRFHGASGGLVPQSTSWSGRSLNTDRIFVEWYGRDLVHR
ncbi:FG-GAP-like repeat-containing protein [Verrucosispora sp. WMMA2044]|uniref:FG-GAP-like repeat-containing protein n=1 Tax=Verrucosispora sp. WMMA2044 TaxID=3016419 RepID=UPI00248BA43A|nr:FG-GAP-like repeat-containing protein [Verrucosispora sp. WMMA2044]WBB48665.1 FG-GAP-like repeat-containing protein [Verrucosispora sp. WMMA2044]